MYRGMERLLAILLLFGSGTAAGAGWFEFRDYDPPPYAQARAEFVVQLARQHGKADTLVLGDSLIEQTDLTDACGRTFNAGIGGARIADVAGALPDLLAATQPDRVVLAIGANHFAAGDEMPVFERDYAPLVDALGKRQVILVGVVNSAAASRLVEAEAERRGMPYVAPVVGHTKADGLHHDVEGSQLYREAIAAGCRGIPLSAS